MSSHIELLPFPEDCILLDTDFEEDNIDSIIEALKINLEEREIADSITIKEKILESEKFLVINKFLTQLIFCSMYQDKCNVSMKQWFKKDKTPQLILASQIDEENRLIRFVGVITALEFKKFLTNKKLSDKISIPLNQFDGGLEVLINYVNLLDYKSIPRIAFKNKKQKRTTEDSIEHYLRTIGKVPPLTSEEEINLAHLVKIMRNILTIPSDKRTPTNRQQIAKGKRARDSLMAANLRLVVAVAKKYQNQGLKLLDLVCEGALGLERAVDKFDPSMGYKFSTYSYWWIRQGITKAIDNVGKKNEVRRINQFDFELLSKGVPYTALDSQAGGEEDRTTLREIIPDPNSEEDLNNVRSINGINDKNILEEIDNTILKDQIGGWLEQLNETEKKIIKYRFGLEGEEPLTLAEIGRQINVSRERVRQLEAKAILKLRVMTNHQKVA